VTRLEGHLAALERFYGLLPSPPHDPFAFFVWEVLSVQAPPARREAAFAALKRAHALTPDAVARAPRARLEAAVGLTGSYLEPRLHALRVAVDLFRRNPRLPADIAGPLPRARRVLEPFPHLDEGATHRMLLFAGKFPALPVDARIRRVASRLGYAARRREANRPAAGLRRVLEGELAPDAAARQHAWIYLAHHAVATCTEGDPHCTVCPLLADCPEGQRRTRSRLTRL
jgi:endonuclease III